MEEYLQQVAAGVLQRQLDMPCPPTGWELVQALEANGFSLRRDPIYPYERPLPEGARWDEGSLD